MQWRRLFGLLAAMVAVASACSGDGGDNSATDAGEISRSEAGHLSVDVGGDLEVTFDEDVDLRIVVIRHAEATEVRFLSVGIEQLQPLPDGTAFRVAFDLAGAFDGAGDYELPAVGKTQRGAPGASGPRTSAVQGISRPYLTYSPAGIVGNDPEALAQIRSFENALKPCGLEVGDDDGGEGTLVCPQLTDAEGRGRISLRMEWETR